VSFFSLSSTGKSTRIRRPTHGGSGRLVNRPSATPNNTSIDSLFAFWDFCYFIQHRGLHHFVRHTSTERQAHYEEEERDTLDCSVPTQHTNNQPDRLTSPSLRSVSVAAPESMISPAARTPSDSEETPPAASMAAPAFIRTMSRDPPRSVPAKID